MRVATRHHHGQSQAQQLHLQVTRSNNGKFFVSPNISPEPIVQARQQQQVQQQQHVEQTNPNNGDEVVVASSSSSIKTIEQPAQEQRSSSSSSQHQPQQQQQQHHNPTILADRFLLLGPAECSSLIRCVDIHSGKQLVAKALQPGDKAAESLLQAQMLMEGSGAASELEALVETETDASQQQPIRRRRYLLLDGHHGDLHAYVRARRRLREPEARRLFKQAARAVASCHRRGVVLRDLKLRKFVFSDEARTELRLESLEDAVLVDEEDDLLSDRRGCPAYVAPEVLRSGRAYSGKAADMWSLGVLLYTMLVGRYPFNDAEHASLFAKISRAHFQLPEALSPRARCLIRALLRRAPHERPPADDVLRHPWLSRPMSRSSQSNGAPAPTSSSSSSLSSGAAGHCQQQHHHHLDQLVPDFAQLQH